MTEVAAALLWQGDRFLICRRPPEKRCGGFWEFAGGKVEPGETGPEALRRECREELDIAVTVGPVFKEVTHTYPYGTIHLTLYHAALAEGAPRLLEHTALRWITAEEAPQYEFCPADREFLSEIPAEAPHF